MYQSNTTEVHHIAWLTRASPPDPNGVITLLENGPHFMSNKVEIVKIIGALRAHDPPALFYLYKSETIEVHQIAWLPKTVIALLVERHFMRNMIGIFEKFGTHTLSFQR